MTPNERASTLVSTPFDRLKAAREELAGMSDVYRMLATRERTAEEALGRAESERNAVLKIIGWLGIALDAQKKKVIELEAEEDSGPNREGSKDG